MLDRIPMDVVEVVVTIVLVFNGVFPEPALPDAPASIAISMDGKGRDIDNVMIERLWRTVKYENIYLKEYTSGADCHQGSQAYFQYYCHERPHQNLSNRTP